MARCACATTMRGSFAISPRSFIISKPFAQRRDVAQVAARDDHHVRRLPVELLHDLDAHRLLALHAQRVHRVGQVERRVLGDLLHQLHAAVEVRVQGEHQGVVGNRLDQLRDGNLAPGQQHHGLDARRRAIRRQRRRGVARRGARHRLDRRAFGDHLFDLRNQHRHAQVLERPAVRVAAQLEPQIIHPDHLAETLRPEQVRPPFVQRHDVVVADLRQDPFLLAPDTGAVRPLVALVAVLEELHPRRGAALGQRRRVVLHLQQRMALLALVHDGVQRIGGSALRVDALKPGSI